MKKLPNIILIICDTLGAKHMSLYGYKRRTTPNLERLVDKEGFAVYTRCFAPAPWTSPSHASLFTGLYPSEHRTYGKQVILNDRLRLISQVFNTIGFSCLGMSNNGLISRLSKFDRGFHLFLEINKLIPNIELQEVDSLLEKLSSKKEKLLYIVKQWLKTQESKYLKYLIFSILNLFKKIYNLFENSAPYTLFTLEKIKKFIQHYQNEKPFFLFVNLMQTHGKYNPPLPFRGIFSSPYRKSGFQKLYKEEDIWFDYYLYPERDYWKEFLFYLQALYDEEILFLDKVLTDFLSFFKKSRFFDNTIVIITSDHGELFGEHGHVHHVFTTYNELIHIPLLIKWPKDFNIKGEVSILVQLHDLYSTLFEIANIPFPPPLSSKSLLSMERRKVAIVQLVDVNYKIKALKNRNSEFKPAPFMQPMMSVITEDFWKITKWLDGTIEVYDLNKDLYETQNLAQDKNCAEKTAKLEKLIDLLAEATNFNKVAVKPIE